MKRKIMEYKSSEIKAGIFIVLSLLVFGGFLVIIAGLGAWKEKDVYKTRFNFVGGIEKGSLVRFSGFELGRVIDIGLPSDATAAGVEVTLEMKKDTPVRENSIAYLTTIGIMGSFYVEVTAGSQDSPLLPPGSVIKSKEVTAFAQMSGSMGDATSELTELIRRANDLLNKESRDNIAAMIASLTEMAVANTENVNNAMQGVQSITSHLDTTILMINRVLQQNGDQVNENLADMAELLEESRDLLARLNDAYDGVNNSILENGGSYQELIENMTSLSRNLDEFSQRLKEQPWNLVRKTYPPERRLPQ
jgi:phospholipid/cholesterol/gamma-HCH transport system substrate-binding protein